MEPLAITGVAFQGVSYCMAVVEDGAAPRFALVFFYDRCFHSDTPCNELAEQSSRGTSKVAQEVRVCLKLGEQLSVEYHTILYYFCPSLNALTRRKGQQGGGIGQHEPGLVERANQVFATRMVNAGFATNCCIDLGQK